ncbi:MAG: hybrid sensor histidine kinase/response regulator [Rhodospirillaceae bacterium]|nr:MAG: hybrid sensor histidine kinase/response regulator [Rhodospirillaceae bacterium]
MARDPHKYFRIEARELLTQFGAVVLELERDGNSGGQVQRLLRLAHTLKGAARVVKEPNIADRAHAIEDVLVPFREMSGDIPRECVDAVLNSLDEIDGRIRELAPAPDGTPVVQSAALPTEDIRTVRADIAEMDAVLDGVTEAHTILNGLRLAPRKLEQAQHLTALLLDQLAPRGARESYSPAFAGQKTAYATAQDLRKGLNGVRSHLGLAIDQMDRELNQLRDVAEQLRLVSADSLFVSLERTVRDTGRSLDKKVAFEGTGGDIRLDAHVLGLVQGALVQVLRNAVAHGIEPAGERQAAGKTVEGLVTLNVSRRGRQIVFTCRDDGRGVDLEAVQRVASRRGILDSRTKSYGAEELLRVLMRGGISTSDTVTEVSGRGIGLDVVREAIEQLGGEVVIRNQAGKGVTFELIVPLSVASLEVLVVEVSGNIVTIPIDAVRTAIRVMANDISWGSDGGSLLYDKVAIPFISLPRALFGTRSPAGRAWSALVVAASGSLAAIGVDRLLDTARVVVRPLPEFVPAHGMIAGASLDAEGNPQLVLDPDGVVAKASHGFTADLEPNSPARPILVVDDSLTTRMLEQSILESAGYDVDLATSGEEGLERARHKRYALILVDVEMPGMDGFTFIQQIRSDPALHDIPAILVTSRAEPEDVQRGLDVRAQGYIVKSEFDQAKLIAMIRPLTG